MTEPPTNRALAERFREAATLVDLLGENAFKAIAFARVAAALEALPEEVAALHGSGGREALEAVKGIGRSSAAILSALLERGRSEDLEALAARLPPEVPAMLELPGLGPKTVGRLWRERGIGTFSALSAALEDGSLATLDGLGPKTLERIRDGLALRAAAAGRRDLGRARALGVELLARLEAIDGVARVAEAGPARRGCETVDGLAFAIEAAPGTDPRSILDAFAGLDGVARARVDPDGADGPGAVAEVDGGLPVEVRVAPPSRFGAALCRLTGSEAHHRRLRALAAERGLALDGRDASGGARPGTFVAGGSEASVYAALGLAWVPPELREDTGEIELAARGAVPALIEAADYRGDLHCHTVASDGTATIDEMAEAARALGRAYLAITDHSVSQRQANGLDTGRLLAHAEAVREANARTDGIELLAGTECDILADGRLDYDDATLAELDWVIASPHVALRQGARAATIRLLCAIENPYVNAIGHPTGRLIGTRAGLPIDAAAVFAAAARTGTALEINASHRRLDLSAELARAALGAGCRLSINTDAHAARGLGKLDGGLATARRAEAGAGDVINCLGVADLRAFVAAKRP